MLTFIQKSNMSIILKSIVVVLLALPVNAVEANNSLKISAPPSIWVQEQNGQLTGPVVDLVHDIFTEYEISVTATPLPWARAIAQMKSGTLDMIPVIFYTEERADFMAFSTPFAVVPTSIFVPAGKAFTYASINDLIGKKGVIMRGDSISQEFELLKDRLDLTEIAAYDHMIHMLADHRADYAVAAQYGFTIQAKKLGYDTKIDMLPQPVASRNLHFALSKKSPYVQYLPIINQKLEKLKTNGKLEQLVENTLNNAAKN